MPDQMADPGPERLCASGDLAEKGQAVVFDVLSYRQPARAFALRFDDGVLAAYDAPFPTPESRAGIVAFPEHVPTELDWQPGEFLDGGREFIICAMHGAIYEPATGRCAGGPCGRGRLSALEITERDGEVYWHPSRDIRPVGEGRARALQIPPEANP